MKFPFKNYFKVGYRQNFSRNKSKKLFFIKCTKDHKVDIIWYKAFCWALLHGFKRTKFKKNIEICNSNKATGIVIFFLFSLCAFVKNLFILLFSLRKLNHRSLKSSNICPICGPMNCQCQGNLLHGKHIWENSDSAFATMIKNISFCCLIMLISSL